MIRPLRQRHRRTIAALALVLPIAFVAGIAARKPVPVAGTLPAELATRADVFGRVVLTKADLWAGERIITRLRRDSAGAIAVEFMFRDVTRPDVLVYWVPGQETIGEGLPDRARLLGPFSNRRPLPIRPDARGERGRLVLYSLADHEIVATSKPIIF